MDTNNSLSIICKNVLENNEKWYALKARHKKISVFNIKIENTLNDDVVVDYSQILIEVNSTQYKPLSRIELIQKIKQFTLDSLFTPLIYTHWVEYLIECIFLFFGVFFNRSLKKVFLPYLENQVELNSNKKHETYISFLKLSQNNSMVLTIPIIHSNGEKEEFCYSIDELTDSKA